MHTNARKKVRFCHRFKGTLVRQILQAAKPQTTGATPMTEPATLNIDRRMKLQQHLWEFSGLAEYPELERFRRTFGKLAAHVIEETESGLESEGGEFCNGIDIRIMAADHGEWDRRPCEAWKWCKAQMKRRAARSMETQEGRDKVMGAATKALVTLSGLRGRIVDAHNLLRRAIDLEAARDLAESSLIREEIEMAVEVGSGGPEKGGIDNGTGRKDATDRSAEESDEEERKQRRHEVLSTNVRKAQEKYDYGLKRAAAAEGKIISGDDDAAFEKLASLLDGLLTTLE
ncbi:hypothetical protein EsH8_XV_000020 [Colletotrichum jinshuiense]